MVMEEVMNELEQGKESANLLMNNLKTPSSSSSSSDSNYSLISKVLDSYENVIVMLSLGKETRKRSHERNDQSHKKRRILEKKKKTEKVKVCVGTEQEGTSLDDGYCWRKYGQKYIHGSKNPRGYYRCTHRFTQGCLAVKQVQKSDTNRLCYEIKYVESHTCNTTPSTSKCSVSIFKEEEPNRGPNLYVTEQPKDTIKSEEVMLSVEDLDNKKEMFRTFSFSNHPDTTENLTEWNNLMDNLSPTTTSSESRITNELLSASVSSVANSPRDDDDSCFSSLENILVLTHDLSWIQ